MGSRLLFVGILCVFSIWLFYLLQSPHGYGNSPYLEDGGSSMLKDCDENFVRALALSLKYKTKHSLPRSFHSLSVHVFL